MALTGYRIVRGEDRDALKRAVLALAADNYLPYGEAQFVESERSWTQAMIIGTVAGGSSAATAILEALLESPEGAAQIGFEADVASPAARTLEDKAQEIITPADTDGGAFNVVLRVGSTPSNGLTYKFGDYNYQHADTEASFIIGGTETQPNYIGKKFHRQTYPGDGTTVDFTVVAPFVIQDETRFNIRAKKRRSTDGAVTPYSEGSGFTVISGYGTNTIVIRMTAAPATTEELEATVISTEDDPLANPQLITVAGYDNVVNPIMSICFGAHCFIGNGSGHNAISGGSFHRIFGSYNTIVGGTSCDIGTLDAASFGCTAGGQSVRVDGSQSFGFGANIRVRGTASGAVGRNHFVNNFNDCWVTGYGGAPTGHNQSVAGYGKSTDNGVAGLRQGIDLGLSIDTTDATQTYFTNSAGSSEILVPPDSATLVRVDVVALRDDNTQGQGFSGQFLVIRVGSAAPTVDGSASDVVVPSIKTFGAAAWVCNIRGISAGFRLRATGEAAKNIRWVGRVTVVQTVY